MNWLLLDGAASALHRRLWWANVGALVVQGVTGVLFLTPVLRVDAYVPVYSHFAAAGRASEEAVLLGHWNLGYLSGLFLLLSAVDHLYVVWRFADYQHHLAAKRNPWRWAEYFFSASLMHVFIALLCGVFDVHLLFAIGGLTATTMLFGHLQEEAPAATGLYTLCWGLVPWLWQWGILWCYFFTATHRHSAPAFVHAILVIEFVFDALFAGAQSLQQTRLGYEGGELLFVLLSCGAKQALAWLNYGGTRAL